MHTVNIFDDCLKQFYKQNLTQFYTMGRVKKFSLVKNRPMSASILEKFAEYISIKYECTYSLELLSRNFILEFKDPEQLALFKLENMQ